MSNRLLAVVVRFDGRRRKAAGLSGCRRAAGEVLPRSIGQAELARDRLNLGQLLRTKRDQGTRSGQRWRALHAANSANTENGLNRSRFWPACVEQWSTGCVTQAPAKILAWWWLDASDCSVVGLLALAR